MPANMNHEHEPDTKSPCWLCVQLGYIWEEARETHPAGMTMREAVRILIYERYERDILTRTERNELLAQYNDWTEAEKREAFGK